MIWHLRVKSPKTGAGRHALPTKSGSLLPAALYSNLKSVRPRTRKSAAYRCSKQDTLCPSFRCRSPSSSEGFPKGRAAARPFVSFQGGAGGNRNPPAFLFRGAGGDILFSKENIPFGFSPRKPGPPFAPKTPSPCPDMGMSPCGSKSSPVPHSGTIMKYPPDPKILLRFPRYGPSGPEGYPPAGGRTPPPFAPHPPA